AEDGIRDGHVTGVQTCALPICRGDAQPVDRSGSLSALGGWLSCERAPTAVRKRSKAFGVCAPEAKAPAESMRPPRPAGFRRAERASCRRERARVTRGASRRQAWRG